MVSASVHDKGFTLPSAAVVQYNSSAVRDSDAMFGNKILWFACSIDLVLVLTLGLLLLQPLVVMFRNIFIKTRGAPHVKFLLAAASFVACAYNIAIAVIGFLLQLPLVHEFLYMKFFFLLVIYLIFAFFIVVYTRTTSTLDHCSHRFGACFVVFNLSTFIAILLLGFTPTIILLFAHPVDTSSLLALHIAITYTSTIVVAIIFHLTYNFIMRHRPTMNEDSYVNGFFKIKHCPCKKCLCVSFISANLFLLLLVLLPLSYICIILFYQFVIIRSDFSGVAINLSDISKYVPSIMIGVIGFLLNKGTFLLTQHRRRRSQNP